MRFNFAKILIAVSVASVAARPTLDHAAQPRDVIAHTNELQVRDGLITNITPIVKEVLKILKLDKLHDPLGRLLNGRVGQALDDLGVTFVLTALRLSDKRPRPREGDIQALGRAVADLLRGLNIDVVTKNLNDATNGAIRNLSQALGLDDVLNALGIRRISGIN